ncbi:hypothetical protein TCAL_15382 [Tigriopus californicus]|uniref:Uncharacterized protein n=1 Tax=Tigriopus californicus TaxID=6832 RepID=A0A553PJH6_TIGCA|nr:hypothetical protein TCAL_15382 [Tigriopus californicus]
MDWSETGPRAKAALQWVGILLIPRMCGLGFARPHQERVLYVNVVSPRGVIRQDLKTGHTGLTTLVVSPSFPALTPRLLCGYNVRLAQSLTEVFHKGGPLQRRVYDLTNCTSERGDSGLGSGRGSDKKCQSRSGRTLFDHYLNTVSPPIGSRTIRTEEALPHPL